AHLWSGWKGFNQLGRERVRAGDALLNNHLALNLGALGSVAAYMVHSFVDFNLHIPANVLLLAFVFGILANDGAEQVGAGRKMSVLWRMPLPVIGVILAFQSYRLLPGEYFTERARTAQRDDRPEAALAFASRGLETEKQNPNLYLYLASAQFTLCDRVSDLHSRAKCYEERVAALQRARALAPADRTVLVQLALGSDAVNRYS